MRHPYRAVFISSAVVAVALGGCGSSLAAAVARPTSALDRLAAVARQRYSEEVTGAAVHKQLRRVASDPVLLRALRSGDLAGLRAEVRLQDATPHAHISRLRVVRGSRVLADAGVVFPVAPAQKALRDAHGRVLATLQLSIQDVIGYVKYMHRNVHVDVVVRGRGAAHMRTSLPAAARVRLPSSGTAMVAGRRYLVRSFSEPGLAGETLRIWILKRG
jgi:HAMP domain-containing protein